MSGFSGSFFDHNMMSHPQVIWAHDHLQGYKNDYRDNVGNFEHREGCTILGIYTILG